MTWLDEQDSAAVDSACCRMVETERGRALLAEASGDERFALWLALVDKRLMNGFGVRHNDLADWRWHDAYSDGLSPAQAGRQALAEEFNGMGVEF